jgi:hypothetical protein
MMHRQPPTEGRGVVHKVDSGKASVDKRPGKRGRFCHWGAPVAGGSAGETQFLTPRRGWHCFCFYALLLSDGKLAA